MRYFGAIKITGPEAAFLMESNLGIPGRPSVVSFEGVWYDVRGLSPSDLERFIDQLARQRLAGPSLLN